MGWNPNMDEAPRDGTPVWLRVGEEFPSFGPRMAVIGWIDRFLHDDHEPWMFLDGRNGATGWHETFGEHAPAEWMFIPEPPADQHYRNGEAA